MKKNIPASLFFISLIFSPLFAFLQTYQLPASYTFDADVVQHFKGNSNGKPSDQAVEFYYTKAGDYMAMKVASENSLIIFTKDGVTIAIDNAKKTIVIFRLPNMSALINANAAKNGASSNADANAKSASIKTGNTKQISGYTAQEYIMTDDKGEKAHVWYAAVDFNAKPLYTSGIMGGKGMMGMPGSARAGNSSLDAFAHTMGDPNTLMAEVESDKHPESTLTTESINKKEIVIPTSGYKVQNMSNMNMQDMIPKGNQ